jgi:hypothetical protein
MEVALLDTFFTVKEVAELVHVTTDRVTQLCNKFSLGQKVGTMRFLTAQDVDEIRKYRDEYGRNRPRRDGIA